MISADAIREGLVTGEFFLEYLPTVSLADGRCVGAEALTRWRRSSGVVQPDDFIPVIEGTYLSGMLTYWVLETVAKELGDWLRVHKELDISINVPPEIIGRGGLEYAAQKTGLSEIRNQLILEITERGIPDNLGVAALQAASRSGVRIALDDVTLTGTNLGPWAGVAPSGLAVSLEVLILFPWDPVTQRFTGERIWFDRGTV